MPLSITEVIRVGWGVGRGEVALPVVYCSFDFTVDHLKYEIVLLPVDRDDETGNIPRFDVYLEFHEKSHTEMLHCFHVSATVVEEHPILRLITAWHHPATVEAVRHCFVVALQVAEAPDECVVQAKVPADQC